MIPSNTPSIEPAVVLCLSGHDPSGGAGIQADIEAVAAQGCHAATVITCLTLQDTLDVQELIPVSRELFLQQARLLCQDFNIAAIKIGALGSASIASAVSELLVETGSTDASIPVVLDPVLAAGGGAEMAQDDLLAGINQLLPRITLLTPNRQEARRLANTATAQDAAVRILAAGCQAVLVTGADESDKSAVVNQLYQPGFSRQWNYPKLPGKYHGSGCTLAASVAARLALGEPMQQALTAAQDYTLQTLRQATHPGKGQAIPRRCIPCTN